MYDWDIFWLDSAMGVTLPWSSTNTALLLLSFKQLASQVLTLFTCDTHADRQIMPRSSRVFSELWACNKVTEHRKPKNSQAIRFILVPPVSYKFLLRGRAQNS
jgi:hypothetical protein